MNVEQFEAKHGAELREVYAKGPTKQFIKLSPFSMRPEQWQALQSLEVLEERQDTLNYCDPFKAGEGNTAKIWRARVDFAEAMDAMGIYAGQGRKFKL